MNTKVARRLIARRTLAAMATRRGDGRDRRVASARADDPPARAAGDFSPYVTKDGGISRPTDYRDTFEYLGTYAVATKPDQPVDEMHDVYARPEDVRAYRRDGKFPDGAVAGEGSHPGRLGEAHDRAIPLGHGHQALVRDDQGRERAIPRQRPVGRRLGLGPLHGQGAFAQRRDRLHDRLQDVPHSGQEGRLDVRPRISVAHEGRPGQGSAAGCVLRPAAIAER